MLKLPQAQDYSDPIWYFRACHETVRAGLDQLSSLVEQKDSLRVRADEWSDTLKFFTRQTPRHEIEEEQGLFALLLKKVPHVGFQPSDSLVRFLSESHEVLNLRAAELIGDWRKLSEALPDEEKETHLLTSAREMLSLYKDHVDTEDQKVYANAAKLLTDAEKEELMQHLIELGDEEHSTQEQQYDTPVISNPQLAPPNIEYVFRPDEGDED